MDFLNKIICGDVVETLQKIPDNYVDLIVTSPPYNLGIKYSDWSDSIRWDRYYDWCEEWMREIYRVMKTDGRFCLNHYFSFGKSGERQSPIMTLNEMAVNEIGFKHHAVVMWEDKTRCKFTAFGSYLSASAPYISSPYEGILVLYKEHWKKQSKGESTISKKEFLGGVSGVWKINPESNKNHPAVFPVKLAKRCINLLSYKGDIVLDTFCGSGTTLVAAKQIGRNYIGIDNSDIYCKMARKRLQGTLTPLFV